MADRPPTGPRPTIGLMVVGSEIVSFTLLGLFLDLVVFNSLPGFTIGLTVLGFVAAFTQLVRMARQMGKPAEPGKDERPGTSGGSA